MAKAILVLDEMPEKCFDCFLTYPTYPDEAEFEERCVITGHVVDLFSDHFPDWCPMKEVPENIHFEGTADHGTWNADYVRGWNDCVDAIEGRRDQDGEGDLDTE